MRCSTITQGESAQSDRWHRVPVNFTGLSRQHALNLLLVLSSYDTYRELREAGLSDRKLTILLQQTARELLLSV